MARVAFIMDRIFRKFGLSGKSFIPMLIGSGCGVPGVMASRTIENDRDRKMTVMTTTFVPCGAKLPIIALIAGAFFDGARLGCMESHYFVGIAAIICSGIILKKTKMFAGEPAPFVMELPAYHMPTVGNVLRSMWERGWSFIKKAGTIILLSTIVLWFLQGFGWVDGQLHNVRSRAVRQQYLSSNRRRDRTGSSHRLAGATGRSAVAAVTGLIAKENVVATFGVLFGFAEVAEDGDRNLGNTGNNHDSSSSIFLLSIQPFMCTLLRCNGSDQTRDEQYEMVLVCNRISDTLSICRITLCIPDWYISYNRSIRSRNCCCILIRHRIHLSAVQTIQRE